MKRNGMCPICYLKRIFGKPSRVSEVYFNEPYGNGVAMTPPMGWSSWNTFKNKIDEDLIYETGVAMKEKGLIDAGYNYLNLDDNWHSSLRDRNGELQSDFSTFPSGIPALVEKLNALGLKVGIYSSNGTHTCEDLPASLGREEVDAYSFAKWGIEYFKYDFCHNIPISKYAPLVYSISTAPLGKRENQELLASDAILYGMAKLMKDAHVSGGLHISGMDAGLGKAEWKNVYAEEDGDYVLTVNIRKKGAKYEKFLLAEVNGKDYYYYPIPPQKFWNYTARFQQVVKLKKGVNTVALMNPIATKADSAMLQYTNMGKLLKNASKRVAEETGKPEKPIVFSICEWGFREPWKWGRAAGNLWRTTGDINCSWMRINQVYNKNVKLHEYAAAGAWNDPDMLEVGNGTLTETQNRAHFSLWCMMAAPLILGNDIRKISDEVMKIVTNKNLIAIDQDKLGKQAKRVATGSVDILAKPLSDGSTAILFYNKGAGSASPSIALKTLWNDEFVKMAKKDKYLAVDQWSGEETEVKDTLKADSIPKDGVKVFILK